MAHNYTDAFHGESNYLSSVVSSKKGKSYVRISCVSRGDNGAARLEKTVVFLRALLPEVPAGNANGDRDSRLPSTVAEYASESAR